MTSEQKQEHPALVASKKSWSAVDRKAKEEWLALFADDAKVEDPVGPTLLDPEGKGHVGKEALSRFWDTNIGPNTIEFNFTQSYVAGQEVAHVGTLKTTFGQGSMFGEGASITVEGVFVYKVNDEGKLVSLRTFWEFDKALASITPAPQQKAE
jgi:steroid delta-isomerase